jgi:hypothetical protein
MPIEPNRLSKRFSAMFSSVAPCLSAVAITPAFASARLRAIPLIGRTLLLYVWSSLELTQLMVRPLTKQ